MPAPVNVFVSSTYKDLKEQRKAIQEGLISYCYTPVAMELFPSKYTDAYTHIKQEIDRSNYYILVLGNRYGSYKPETDISFTEHEYEYALSKKMKVLAFVCSDVSKLEGADEEPDREAKVAKFAAFKKKIEERHLPTWWSHNDGLKFEVCRSIYLDQQNAGKVSLMLGSLADYDWARDKYVFSLVLTVNNNSSQTLYDSKIEVWSSIGQWDVNQNIHAFGVHPDDSCTLTSNNHRDLIFTPKAPIHPGTQLRLGTIVQTEMLTQTYYTIGEEGSGKYPRLDQSLTFYIKLFARDMRMQEAEVVFDKARTNDRLECCRRRPLELTPEITQFTPQ